MSEYFPTEEECGRHTIFKGVSIRTMACEKMMISLVDLSPHAIVEEHAHPHEQVGMLLQGEVIFYIGDEHKRLKAGDLFRIPGNIPHKVVVLDKPAKAIDIFHPIREEYR
jgi:quercetin dioxygenase-like cupin family protein